MTLKPNQFFIPTNVPSSKNSRRCLCNKRAVSKTGTTNNAGVLLSSELLEKYLEATKMHWFDVGKKFREYVTRNTIPYPLVIRIHLIRTDKHSFDWTGPLETIQDCMSGGKFKSYLKGLKLKTNPWAWIPDDSVHYMTPDLVGSTHRVAEKGEKCGVIIEVVH